MLIMVSAVNPSKSFFNVSKRQIQIHFEVAWTWIVLPTVAEFWMKKKTRYNSRRDIFVSNSWRHCAVSKSELETLELLFGGITEASSVVF